VALADPRLAGIHFTGSTGTFQHLWREVGNNIDRYHTYPRLVGETGGKDFGCRAQLSATGCAAHGTDSRRIRLPGPEVLSRVASVHPALGVAADGDDFLSATEALRYGDVADLSNYGGALIDERAFAKNVSAIERARARPT